MLVKNVKLLIMMENVSVSKGSFSFTDNFFGEKNKINKYQYQNLNDPWYFSYEQIWRRIQNSTEEINDIMFKQILEDLRIYVSSIYNGTIKVLSSEIPTAILLAGINVPDHKMLFEKVVSTLSEVTPYIATVSSKNCNNMKNMVEESIYQLINANIKDDPIIKKAHCTFRALNSWNQESNPENLPLVIIIRDFENFSAKALHDFVYDLSIYSTLNIVLIIGVATSLHVVHRTLSYDVTSKLRVKVFATQTQIKSLSDTLEGIVFSYDMPFRLTGNAYNFLQDVFLFYDFSVDGFLQAYKICLIHHFFGNNYASLCCDSSDTEKRIESLTSKDINELRELKSVAKYFQYKNGLSDKQFKKFILDCMQKFRTYMREFLSVLRCFHVFVRNLTNAPLGQHFREIYGKAVSCNLIDLEDYKKALQLLKYLAKEEFLSKLTEVLDVAKNNEKFLPKGFKESLEKNFKIIRDASLEVLSPTKSEATVSDSKSPKSEINKIDERFKRLAFVEDLKIKARKHSHSVYKEAQENFIEYLDTEVFSVYLKNPQKMVGYEIFCFYDSNLVKYQIKGSLRAAVHNALEDPQHYLKCDCCHVTTDGEILNTMPDLNIIYKLHLENKKLINMYDWLQAFLTIVDPNDEDEQREVDPALNARFSQAVAELQFLGYIKGSNRKTDHVKRLT